MNAQSGQSSLLWVNPNNPQQSYLYLKIAGTHSSVDSGGAQMPKNMSPMSSTEMSIVEQWILDGANP